MDVDIVVRVPAFRAEHQAGEVSLAEEVLLGQRRALIRVARLGGDDGDGPLVLQRAQLGNERKCGLTTAHNNQSSRHDISVPSLFPER
jgi:hypothetical protein